MSARRGSQPVFLEQWHLAPDRTIHYVASDGTIMRTTPVVSAAGTVVTTSTGSVYHLGNLHSRLWSGLQRFGHDFDISAPLDHPDLLLEAWEEGNNAADAHGHAVAHPHPLAHPHAHPHPPSAAARSAGGPPSPASSTGDRAHSTADAAARSYHRRASLSSPAPVARASPRPFRRVSEDGSGSPAVIDEQYSVASSPPPPPAFTGAPPSSRAGASNGGMVGESAGVSAGVGASAAAGAGAIAGAGAAVGAAAGAGAGGVAGSSAGSGAGRDPSHTSSVGRSGTKPKKQVGVRFGDVEIREYERVAYDSTKSGAPRLGLGWDLKGRTLRRLDSLEREREPVRTPRQSFQPLSVEARRELAQDARGLLAGSLSPGAAVTWDAELDDWHLGADGSVYHSNGVTSKVGRVDGRVVTTSAYGSKYRLLKVKPQVLAVLDRLGIPFDPENPLENASSVVYAWVVHSSMADVDSLNAILDSLQTRLSPFGASVVECFETISRAVVALGFPPRESTATHGDP